MHTFSNTAVAAKHSWAFGDCSVGGLHAQQHASKVAVENATCCLALLTADARPTDLLLIVLLLCSVSLLPDSCQLPEARLRSRNQTSGELRTNVKLQDAPAVCACCVRSRQEKLPCKQARIW